jgi:hypothetical protein
MIHQLYWMRTYYFKELYCTKVGRGYVFKQPFTLGSDLLRLFMGIVVVAVSILLRSHIKPTQAK